ncbi:Mpp10 family of U3 processosome protein [Cryptosporidium ryanae]|uniref:Mpp10 family of U3 processosome protein n=1 Tax=Cryptosporidium ryanae TaxID=515981 RepID=UPI00351AA1AE|nr:Mpp10 family of U3 processosome protein [Cryptosporidium ryanae]
MDDIEVFIKNLSDNIDNLNRDVNEVNRIKYRFISIFSSIFPDVNEALTTHNLLSKCDHNQVSLWNSLELLMKPELKKLYSRILKFHNKVNKGTKNDIFVNFANKYRKEIIKTKKNKSMLKSRCGENEDIDLFDYEDMTKFVNNDVEISNLNTDSLISDLSDLDSEISGKNIKYSDFFSQENGEISRKTNNIIHNFDLDLQKYSSSETYNKNRSDEEALFEQYLSGEKIPLNLLELSEETNEAVKFDKNPKSKLKNEQEQINRVIDELEENIIREKEWYNLGESSTSNRSKNSLLDLHLEIPHYSSLNNHEIYKGDTLENTNENCLAKDKTDINVYIEGIVKQRIIDNLFDEISNTESITIETEQNTPDIQVEKSKLSLSEIYSKKYEEQINGNKFNENITKEKNMLAEQFSLIINKLDGLSNQYFASGLPTVFNLEKPEIPTLKVEDTIPVIISDNSRVAPQELKKQGKFVSDLEFTRFEKRAHRERNKLKLNKEKKGNTRNRKESIYNNNVGLSKNKRNKRLLGENYVDLPNKRIKSHHLELGN